MNRFNIFLLGTRASFCLLMLCLLLTGCNTLASLGLPGSTGNEIIKPAKQISESPGQALSMPKELAIEPLSQYLIEMGDTVLIEPVKFDATIRLPGDQIVKPDGTISLGEFGRMYVLNKTIEQIRDEAQGQINAHLQQDLQQAYERSQSERTTSEREDNDSVLTDSVLTDSILTENGVRVPLEPLSKQEQEERVALQRRISDAIVNNEISARLISWDSKKIYVLGEVNSPGSFLYTGNQTALDAIIEAGGMTSRANRHEIIVSRPTPCSSCRNVMKLCYDQIVQLGDASTNYQLYPGDRVFVPALTFKEDLRQTFRGNEYDHCPRCANCPEGCALPVGCE